jgi:integrase
LRRASVSFIHVDDIDLEARTLHVPKPKGGEDRAYTIPLSDAALVLIERRLAENAGVAKQAKTKPSPFLFPSASSKSGHIVDVRPKNNGVSFTIHGLRHTYLSAAAAANVNLYHAKLLANHKLPKNDVTAGYISADVDALRPSQQAITDYFKEHGLEFALPTSVEAMSVRKVVPIRRSR